MHHPVKAMATALGAAPHWARPALASLVPGTFERFGPPRRWARNAAHARRKGVEWRVVEPAHPVAPVMPQIEGRIDPMFWRDRVAGLPAMGVLQLSEALVVGTQGVVARDGTYLPDCGYFRLRVGKSPLYARAYGQPVERLPGTTLSLATDFADANYYHLLLDAVPRLDLLEAAGFRMDEVDHVYLPSLDSPVVRAIWSRLRIPPAKVISTRDHPVIRCERLLATSYPGSSNEPSPRAVRYIRRHLRDGTRQNGTRRGTRRIFVSRRGIARDLVNADEIEGVVRRLGFEIRLPGQQADDLEAFSEAIAVLGVHGAGTGNAVLMEESGVLVDLFPPEFQTRCHFSWSRSAGVRYHGLVGEPAGSEHVPPMLRPFRVDAARLERFLKGIPGCS
jgi:capsular polysaccharide biosynthesis protein